jgi:hypothetical protein
VAVADPAVIVAAAAKVMFCATPAIRVRVPGCAVIPAGSPLSEIVTGALNPFTALAVTLTGWPGAPPVSEAVAGDTLRVKSGVGAGMFVDVWVPPQPTVTPVIATMTVTTSEPSSQSLRMPVLPRGGLRPHMQNRAGKLWMDIIAL